MGDGAPYPDMLVPPEYVIDLFLKPIMILCSIGSILVYKNLN